jgi:hypothetical protein
MSEGSIPLNADHDAIHLTIKRIIPGRGVGLGQLTVVLEVSPAKPSATRLPLWIEGSIRTTNLGLATGFLTRLHGVNGPTTVPDLGGRRSIMLEGEIGLNQLQAIEDARTIDVELNFQLFGHVLHDGLPIPFWGVNIDYEIRQSDWIALLGQIGYKDVLLLEFDQPEIGKTAEFQQAHRYFVEAREHYLKHEWRQTVESLRQCLAAMVGKTADDEDQEVDIKSALKAAKNETRSTRVDYQRRFELVRQALKFTTDLGGHPEAAETTKAEAHCALIMTAGLLGWFGGL